MTYASLRSDNLGSGKGERHGDPALPHPQVPSCLEARMYFQSENRPGPGGML